MLLWCQCKAACDESKLSCDIHSLDNLCEIYFPFLLTTLRVLFLFMTVQARGHLMASHAGWWMLRWLVWEYTYSTQVHCFFFTAHDFLPPNLASSPVCSFRCGATTDWQQVWLGGREGCGEWERGAARSELQHLLHGNFCQDRPQHWWGQRSFDDVTWWCHLMMSLLVGCCTILGWAWASA